MSATFRSSIAEMVGTFTLTFVGAGAIIANDAGGGGGIVAIALAHGLALSMAVFATGHISGGHINPAVTLAMFATKRISLAGAAAYIASQCAGAAIASVLHKSLFPAAAVQATRLGATLGTAPNQAVLGTGGTLIVEAILTFLLITTIFGVAVDPRGPKNVYGFAIGLTVCFDILCAGPLTGASMNPARSFGPALAGGYWEWHHVYWLGPILGAVAGGLLYDTLLISKDKISKDKEGA
ncbi:MAG: aquaporin [Planctomycetes bacterium]|nr:aquaporin [Planctomycetota bacterium]